VQCWLLRLLSSLLLLLPPGLLVHGIEGSSNDKSSDLARAGADFVQLGVSEEAAHWVVVDVAIPA